MLDLGRDHYHLQGDALTALGEKVRHGNMEDVLKVYEAEMKANCFTYYERGYLSNLFLRSPHLRML